MHIIYQINRLTTTKVDSTYLGWLTNNAQRICPVAGLERMTTGSAVSALPFLATQVDNVNNNIIDSIIIFNFDDFELHNCTVPLLRQWNYVVLLVYKMCLVFWKYVFQ